MRAGWMSLAVVLLGLQMVWAQELFDLKAADERFSKGLSLYFKKDYSGAIKEFQEALQINPKDARAYYFIGYSYYKLREFSRASEAFRQAYELDANYSPVHQPPSAPDS